MWGRPAPGLKSALNRPASQFAPGWRRLIVIFVGAVLATAVFYNFVLMRSYSAVDQAVVSANVVDATLRTLPQFPIGPGDAQGGARLTTELETAGAFEVLKAWGVLPRTMQLAQILKADTAVEEEVDLVGMLVRCTEEDGIQGTTTLMLLRCSIPHLLGGANENDSDCLWIGLNLALTGYPGSAADLATHTANRLGEGERGSCPARADAPRILRFAMTWFGEARDEVGILRNLLLATGALPYPGTAMEVANADGAKAPAWWHLSELHVRFLAEVISRIETSQSVKAAWSWVVLWRGPEQFLLILTGLLLLFLLVDRVGRRALVRREAEIVLKKLPAQLADIRALEEPRRSTEARLLSNRLESADEYGNSLFTREAAGESPVRADSVVVYLAEKAVRRIVIEPREPELFRQTCDSVGIAVDRSGWLLRFAARALPAVGFIGTVRGIMVALPAAQNLFGTTGPQQIAALGGVIEPLGLAFATTLIALVAGLITGLIGDWEIAQEQVLLARIEDTLIDHIDPAEDPVAAGPAGPKVRPPTNPRMANRRVAAEP